MIIVHTEHGTIEFPKGLYHVSDENGWICFLDEDGLSVGMMHKDKIEYIQIVNSEVTTQ